MDDVHLHTLIPQIPQILGPPLVRGDVEFNTPANSIKDLGVDMAISNFYRFHVGIFCC